ncbi:MAG: LacI family transcriptional regulator [Actinomyces sp.]|jgi:DNA-binding LacI/PurR family transcriptional regulator|nr:LacI family DNA-binding transcriptional regulator [Actinomyces sp.]MCI1788335.1 LacI family transcriptional regulator [Actinomyces sp.]
MSSRKDVAEAAGVSVRTVSNVVNGFKHVAPETRERVLAVIKQLDYHPSELARSLKAGRSGLVGLMLPSLDVPYFAEITRAIVEQGARHGLTVVIDETTGDRARELAWIERASHRSLFDGLILSPLALTSEDLEALPHDLPVIFLGEDRYPGFDQVTVDGCAAARDAVTHLAGAGRHRIAAIGAEPTSHGTSTERLEGYLSGLAEAGLDRDDALCGYVTAFTRGEGHRAMADLLDRGVRVDAAFCFSDALALGALRALHEHGVRVPDDVALVGFDDIEDGRYSIPSLSTIRPDKRWLARTAFDRLVRRLSGESPAPEVVLAPYDLVVRESSPV